MHIKHAGDRYSNACYAHSEAYAYLDMNAHLTNSAAHNYQYITYNAHETHNQPLAHARHTIFNLNHEG